MNQQEIRLQCLKLATELERAPESALRSALLFYSFVVQGVQFAPREEKEEK